MKESTLPLQPTSPGAACKSMLLGGLRDIEAQLTTILDAVSLEQYNASIPGYSSLGAHMRHIIEFTQAVSVEQSAIDYDARERNMEVEQSIDAARVALKRAMESITTLLEEHDVEHPIDMLEKISPEHASVPAPSTLGREIAFVAQHGVHHIFIIKLLAHAQGIALDDDIGVAAATLAYRNSQ